MFRLLSSDDSSTALMFQGGEGHRALYTRDLSVDATSVVQFDVRNFIYTLYCLKRLKSTGSLI